MPTRRRTAATIATIALAMGATACGQQDINSMGLLSGGLGGGGESTGAQGDSADPDSDGDGGTGGGGSTSSPDPDGTDDGSPGVQQCVYDSTTMDQPLQHMNVMDPNSPVRLTFSVPNLPDPALIESARLLFDSRDADHPGEEGFIYVGGGVFDIPANLDWNEQDGTGDVDITGYTVAGTNTIEFGPGPLEWSYFFIGNVQLEVLANVDACDDGGGDGDPGDDWNGVEQTIDFRDAEYTGRHNWVLRCDGLDYAFTAANPKHTDSDCEGLYAPDGSAHGTAIFHFQDVVEDDYRVEIHAYHTWNRNPNGALVFVDGLSGRVNQRSKAEGVHYFDTAQWGIAHLSGDVDIVMDSSEPGYASDSVAWIRIVPD